MRRLDKYLLPILTCLVVLVAILFPRRLSQWRDEAVLNGLHTEELKTENDLPTQPLSLEERMLLLAMYADGLEENLTVIAQEQEWDEETDALLRTELERLSANGVLPTGPLVESVSGFSAQRLYLRSPEEIRGASFLTIDVHSKAEKLWLTIILDEETGFALALEASGLAVEKFDAVPSDIGILFLDRLGLEYTLDGYAEYDAGFTLTGTDCGYIVIKGRDDLHISPWTFCGTENASAAVDSGDSEAVVYPK